MCQQCQMSWQGWHPNPIKSLDFHKINIIPFNFSLYILFTLHFAFLFPLGKRICPPEQFQCANGLRCVDRDDVCDSENHCGDFSDEAYCSMYLVIHNVKELVILCKTPIPSVTFMAQWLQVTWQWQCSHCWQLPAAWWLHSWSTV